MGRLVVAVAATAALGAGAARAEQPRASIEGDLKADLRASIARAVGETDKPISNRFVARRRAREAGKAAVDLHVFERGVDVDAGFVGQRRRMVLQRDHFGSVFLEDARGDEHRHVD